MDARRALLATGVGLVGTGVVRHRLALRHPHDITDELALLHDPFLRPPTTSPEVRTVVTADGTRLHVELHGPADGPLLVLSHGWTCSTKYWWPQVHSFAGQARVVTYDQRGHGGSGAGHGRLTADVLGDDLAAVLAAVVPEGRRATLVGHSMGAMSVVAWAGRHPEQVARLAGAVLLASTALDGLMAESMLLRLPGVGPATMGLVGGWLVSAPTPVVQPSRATRRLVQHVALSPTATDEQVEFCERIVLDCSPRARARWGSALSKLDLRESLARLTVPTSVLVGTWDRLTPRVHAAKMADVLRAAGTLEHLVELPRIGHMTSVEAQPAFDAEVRHLMELTARA